MNRIAVLAGIAVVGAAIAVAASVDTNRPPPTKTVAPPVEQVPFATWVAGTGITETGRRNVAIGTPVAGLVREIDVRVGDEVAAGDPLFRIDDRDLQARLLAARANVVHAEAALDKPRHQLDYLSHLRQRDKGAVSEERLTTARDDLHAAQTALDADRAVVAQIQADIERLVIRAPSAGRILQIDTRVGEYAANDPAKPLMLFGDDRRMYLRIDIDENDAWRIRPGAAARAFVRGNPRLSVPLRYEYIEPYVVPKTSLTGQTTERTDTRVLQVVYSFERGTLPVYLGQQMDAFIEAPPAAAGTTGERD